MELKPKIGIDILKFGMTRKEIIEILGDPDRILTEDYGIEDEIEHILEWNNKKLRLTFQLNENDRFTYFRTKNHKLSYNGKQIFGKNVDYVKSEVFSELKSGWEIEDCDFFIAHFNEDYWLTLSVEYGIVNDFEMGVSFKNDNEYEWPK